MHTDHHRDSIPAKAGRNGGGAWEATKPKDGPQTILTMLSASEPELAANANVKEESPRRWRIDRPDTGGRLGQDALLLQQVQIVFD